ncbi:MAG: GDP-mannose 4,6-dehydratase, partial [Pseudomonadota bacterium]
FVIPSFAAQIARAETGQGDRTVRVGNLSAERDFLHIEDVISAYLAAIRYAVSERPGVETFNIASGRAVSIQAILDGLLRLAGAEIHVETDPERLRPSEVPLAVGNCQRAELILGWKANKSLEQMLYDVLNYWREAARI